MRSIIYMICRIYGERYIVKMKQTEIFRLLSDETRLRALLLIRAEKELCVCELVQALNISQPKISRHMAALRESGLVQARRHAQWVFYSIRADLPDWQLQLLGAAAKGCEKEKRARQDAQRLAAMKGRPDRCVGEV